MILVLSIDNYKKKHNIQEILTLYEINIVKENKIIFKLKRFLIFFYIFIILNIFLVSKIKEVNKHF